MSHDLPPRRRAPPRHQPPGHSVAYDAFEPRFHASRPDPLLLVIGLEHRGGDAGGVRERLLAALGAADGPDVLEHGAVRPGLGGPAEVWFAYWCAPDAYARWTATSGIDELFGDRSLLVGGVGLFRERCFLSLDHNETSGSRPTRLSGLATLGDGMATTDLHGYWGSARDRIVAAAEDDLAAPSSPVPSGAHSGLRRRLKLQAPPNACLIRTSQDLADANPEQRAWYRAEVEPALLEGLRHLQAEPEASGCFGVRFIDERDVAGRRLDRTCALAYFRSLDALEAWTHRHPTHDRIMGAFLEMVGRFSGEPGLHLWHEVTVLPAGALAAEYVNCAMDGGLAGLARQGGL